MRLALESARRAEALGEVPVGAVLVQGGRLLAEGWNQPISLNDPSAHAEIIALRVGGERERNYRLVGSTLYVTLEPCAMCMGAISHARIQRLVYGAPDPARGCAGSVLDLSCAAFLNHRTAVTGEVLVEDCAVLLRDFFRQRR